MCSRCKSQHSQHKLTDVTESTENLGAIHKIPSDELKLTVLTQPLLTFKHCPFGHPPLLLSTDVCILSCANMRNATYFAIRTTVTIQGPSKTSGRNVVGGVCANVDDLGQGGVGAINRPDVQKRTNLAFRESLLLIQSYTPHPPPSSRLQYILRFGHFHELYRPDG